MSNLFRLSSKDLIRGLIVAVLTAILPFIQEITTTQNLEIDWGKVASIGIMAGIGYLIKNFLTDDTGKLGGKYQVTIKQ